MHPGPVNRGVEVAAEVADQPASVITRQVANGVAVRMAVLYLLLGVGGRPCRRLAGVGAPSSSEAARSSTPPARGRADVLIQDGVIATVGSKISSVPAGTVVLDASGCVVAPGLVDLHAHLRQPGREEAETVATGARAAALGGYTAVVAMPNTEPAIDSRGRGPRGARPRAPDVVLRRAGGRGHHRRPPGPPAGPDGRDGRPRACASSPTTAPACRTPGSCGGPWSTPPASGVTLAQHCEDASLAGGGHMHEGEWSSRLGIPGQPAEAEELMVMRDLALARLTGAPSTSCTCRRAGSLAMIRGAKASGLAVTAEVAPHHFTLTDAEVASYDPVFKVNPPLRSGADVAAVKAALADGVVDAIATDHAPHAQESQGGALRPGPARACSAWRRRWAWP